MKSAFQIHGMEEYIEHLRKTGEDVNKISREALEEVSNVLLVEMQSRVPVDTGNLYEHIKIKTPTKEGDFNYREIGIIHDIAYTDKKTAIQARSIEFGTVHAHAQSFIRTAIRAKRGVCLEIIKNRLKNAGIVDG